LIVLFDIELYCAGVLVCYRQLSVWVQQLMQSNNKLLY